jgi:hypothetical protein
VSEIEPELPSGYAEVLASLKELVVSAQLSAQRAASRAMVEMYWGIGRTILERPTKVAPGLAVCLQNASTQWKTKGRAPV